MSQMSQIGQIRQMSQMSQIGQIRQMSQIGQISQMGLISQISLIGLIGRIGVILSAIFFIFDYAEADMAKLTEKKVVMVIAEKDFRDEEFLQPKEILEEAGVKVEIASATTNQATGSLGTIVEPDISLEDVDVNSYDAVVFVGGSGSRQYWNDERAHKIAKEAFASGKIVAAICSAGVTLANAGLLEHKKATVWHQDAQLLKNRGALYTGKDVEIDGNIVTADGPMSAAAFGKALVKKLSE